MKIRRHLTTSDRLTREGQARAPLSSAALKAKLESVAQRIRAEAAARAEAR